MLRTEHGDPDLEVADRGHVHFGLAGPVHLDEVVPRREREVPTQPESPRPTRASGEPGQLADGRVQAVTAEHPARLDPGSRDGVRGVLVRLDLPDRAVDTDLPRAVRERRVQRRPAHAPADTVPEGVIDPADAVLVAHAGERASRRVDAEPRERRDGSRHEPFTAGLVDRYRPRFDDGDRESGHPRLDRGGKPDRPTSRDEDVDHLPGQSEARDAARRNSVRARFSTGIRKANSSTALSAVNATAVIHAVCTSGSAKPSTTTAT